MSNCNGWEYVAGCFAPADLWERFWVCEKGNRYGKWAVNASL